MKILIIDSTTEVLKVFIAENKKIESFEFEDKNLFSLLDNIFSSHKDIQYIAINKGPGSFTRTKVGLSYIKGFCYASKIPLIAISGFEVLEKEGKKLIINAGRGKVYLKDEKGYKIEKGEARDSINYDKFLDLVLDRIERKIFDDPLKVLPLYVSEI